ncbi:MAG TPA: hypothetical protein VLG38_04800 [Gammaproteobacteria bacterium]|nr:hypothetical protein [Gammaproteobacteria bacterium]
MNKSPAKDNLSLAYSVAQLNELAATIQNAKRPSVAEIIEATNRSHEVLVRLRNGAKLITDNPELEKLLTSATSITEQLYQVAQEESIKFSSPNVVMKKITTTFEGFLNKTISKKNQQYLRKAVGLIPCIDGVVECCISLPYYFNHADRHEKVALILSSVLLVTAMAVTIAMFCTPLAAVVPLLVPAVPSLVLFGRMLFAQIIHNAKDRYEDKTRISDTLEKLDSIKNGMLDLTNQLASPGHTTDVPALEDDVQQLHALADKLQTKKSLSGTDLKSAADKSYELLNRIIDTAKFIPDNTNLIPFLNDALEITHKLQEAAHEETTKFPAPNAMMKSIGNKFEAFINVTVSKQNQARFRKVTGFIPCIDGVVECCATLPYYFHHADRNEKLALALSATLLMVALAVTTAILCSPAAPALPFLGPVIAGTVALSRLLYSKAIMNAKQKYEDKTKVLDTVKTLAKIEDTVLDMTKLFPKDAMALPNKPHITVAEDVDKTRKAQQRAASKNNSLEEQLKDLLSTKPKDTN